MVPSSHVLYSTYSTVQYVFRRLVCMRRSGIWSVPVYFGADGETSAHEQSETLVLVHLDEWSTDSAPSHSGKLCA
jgi:hypothetical protein